MTTLLYDTCDRCGGDGYAPVPFTKHLYYFPCRSCHGSGERPRPLTRIWLTLRHGAKSLTDGNY